MDSRNSSLLCVALALLAFSSAIEAFDITKILAKYPEFNTFNKYLTETKLADDINKQKAVTVLPVEDSGITSLSGKSPAALKAILSSHVILKYIDEKTLILGIQANDSTYPTLVSTTNPPNKQMGLVKAALINEGEVAFGPAIDGSVIGIQEVRPVETVPEEVSVIQVYRPIIVPGIEGQSSSSPSVSSPASSASSPSDSSSSPAPKADAPSETPASSTSPAPSSDSMAPSSEITPSSSVSPAAEEASSPVSEVGAPSEAPVAAVSSSSSSPRIQMGLAWAAVMGFGTLWAAM